MGRETLLTHSVFSTTADILRTEIHFRRVRGWVFFTNAKNLQNLQFHLSRPFIAVSRTSDLAYRKLPRQVTELEGQQAQMLPGAIGSDRCH